MTDRARRARIQRPALLPGLRRLWRDRTHLQLGTDPSRAVVIELADPTASHVLDLLDGSRSRNTIMQEAGAEGIDEAAAGALIDLLADAGLVVPGHALSPPGLPESTRRRLAAEMSALALRGTVPPAVAVRRRQDAHVLVGGHARLATQIATALASAGVGHVDTALSGLVAPGDTGPGGLLPGDAGRPRATAAADAVMRAAPTANVRTVPPGAATLVVRAGMFPPAALAALSYARRGVPHLALDVRDGVAVVGPFVPPAGSPCLNCLDLHRRDLDPVWPALAAQLSTGPPVAPPCEVSTLLLATAYATAEALCFLDGGTPRTVGTTIEIFGPGRERCRTWSPHPLCHCGARRRPGTGGWPGSSSGWPGSSGGWPGSAGGSASGGRREAAVERWTGRSQPDEVQ